MTGAAQRDANSSSLPRPLGRGVLLSEAHN